MTRAFFEVCLLALCLASMLMMGAEAQLSLCSASDAQGQTTLSLERAHGPSNYLITGPTAEYGHATGNVINNTNRVYSYTYFIMYVEDGDPSQVFGVIFQRTGENSVTMLQAVEITDQMPTEEDYTYYPVTVTFSEPVELDPSRDYILGVYIPDNDPGTVEFKLAKAPGASDLVAYCYYNCAAGFSRPSWEYKHDYLGLILQMNVTFGCGQASPTPSAKPWSRPDQ